MARTVLEGAARNDAGVERAAPFGTPVWSAIASEPAPVVRCLEGAAKADVAIIGAGFTGLSAALALAGRGARVVVLEAGEIGAGASGRNGGQVIPGLKLDRPGLVDRFGDARGGALADFADRAADRVFDLVTRHAMACDPVRSGWIQAAHAVPARETIARRAEALAARGEPVAFLSREEMAARLGSDVYLGGMLDRRAGVVNPLAYARGLARAAIACGALVHTASPVTKLEQRNQTWHLASPLGSIEADQVLLATNGYTGDLWPGLKSTILPVQSIQIATAPLPAGMRLLPGGECVSETRKLALYFRRSADGRLVFGGRGAVGAADRDVLFGALRGLLARAFPELAALSPAFRWSGTVAMTLDQLPHLHDLAPGLVAALGYNGRGVAMATALGEVAADRLLGRSPDELPVPVTPMRPIPWRVLRGPVLAAGIAWYRIKDRLGLAS